MELPTYDSDDGNVDAVSREVSHVVANELSHFVEQVGDPDCKSLQHNFEKEANSNASDISYSAICYLDVDSRESEEDNVNRILEDCEFSHLAKWNVLCRTKYFRFCSRFLGDSSQIYENCHGLKAEPVSVGWFMERLKDVIELQKYYADEESFYDLIRAVQVHKNYITTRGVYNTVCESCPFYSTIDSVTKTEFDNTMVHYLRSWMKVACKLQLEQSPGVECSDVMADILFLPGIIFMISLGVEPSQIAERVISILSNTIEMLMYLLMSMMRRKMMDKLCSASNGYFDAHEDERIVLHRETICFRVPCNDLACCNLHIVESDLNGINGEETNTNCLDNVREQLFEGLLYGFLWITVQLHDFVVFLTPLNLGFYFEPVVTIGFYVTSGVLLLTTLFYILRFLLDSSLYICYRSVRVSQTFVAPVVSNIINRTSSISYRFAQLVKTLVRCVVMWAVVFTLFVCFISSLFIIKFFIVICDREVFWKFLQPILFISSVNAHIVTITIYKSYCVTVVTVRLWLGFILMKRVIVPGLARAWEMCLMVVSFISMIFGLAVAFFIEDVSSSTLFIKVLFGISILWVFVTSIVSVDEDSLYDFLSGDYDVGVIRTLKGIFQGLLPARNFAMGRNRMAPGCTKKHVRARTGNAMVEKEHHRERFHGPLGLSCPYEHRGGCVKRDTCPYQHGIAQSVCPDFLRGRCNTHRCGWAHPQAPPAEDVPDPANVFSDEFCAGLSDPESLEEPLVDREIIFLYHLDLLGTNHLYVNGKCEFVDMPLPLSIHDDTKYLVNDPYSSGMRKSKRYGDELCWEDHDGVFYLGPLLGKIVLPSFQLGTQFHPKQQVVFCQPWVDALIKNFSNIGTDTRSQGAVFTWLDKMHCTSLDCIKYGTQISFLYRMLLMYPNIPPNPPNIVRNVIKFKLNVLSTNNLGFLSYNNDCCKEMTYKYNGLFKIEGSKGFQFELDGHDYEDTHFNDMGDGYDISVYPVFDTHKDVERNRPTFCSFFGFQPWNYYSRCAKNSVAALPRLLLAREGEGELNSCHVHVLAPEYIDGPIMSDFLSLCDSHYEESAFEEGVRVIRSDLGPTITITTDPYEGHTPIPFLWVQKFIQTLTSPLRVILCYLALVVYFSNFLSGSLFEVFDVCYTNIFGYLDTNSFLALQTELPTPKRRLYKMFSEEFKVLWSLFFGGFVVQLKVKDEVAKFGGYPRLFGSLDGAVLAGRGVVDFAKLLFSGLGFLPAIVIAGYRYEFCDCQDRSSSDTFFQRLLMSDSNTFYFYSDDSMLKFVIKDQVYLFETDINKCDMSNRLTVFYYTYLLIRTIFGKTVADNIIRQAHSMMRLVNPSERSEFVNFLPFFFFESSGLLITTLLNNVASFFIAMSIFAIFESRKVHFSDWNSDEQELVDALMEIIKEGARNIGYTLTIKYCATPTDATFLKRMTDGVVSTKCLGVLLRTFGIMDEYTHVTLGITAQEFASLTDEQRFEVYGHNRVEEHKNDPGNLILDALRKRFGCAGATDRFKEEALKDRYPLINDLDWMMLVDCIENLSLGDNICNKATCEIFRVDYGVDDA